MNSKIRSTNKLQALNSIEVVDDSCAEGECEYVLAEINAANIWKLLMAGFATYQVDEAMGDDKDYIDLSILAFHHATARWWSRKDGFTENGQ